MRSISIVSPHAFDSGEINRIMGRMGAQCRDGVWRLVRNNRSILVQIGNEDLEVMFDREMLREMGKLFKARPRGRLSVVFTDSEDGFEDRMARALALAMAEVWPIVFNDHTGAFWLVEFGAPNG